MKLDYRSPKTHESRLFHVVNRLVAAEALGVTTIFAKIAFGVPMCLVGPFLIASIITSGVRQFGHHSAPLFFPTFVLIALVLVPLLLWLERRTRGEYLSDALAGETRPSSYGEFEMQRFTILWKLYTEIALFGPRLVWNVIDHLRGKPVAEPKVRTTAAQVIIDLLDAGEGVPLRELVRADRSARELMQAVQYLQQGEWIDVSARRDRVWLPAAVREKFANV